MKINTTWTFGNFNITAECDIPVNQPVDKLTEAMLRKGFLQLLQRGPASAAEKAIAGYEKRPAGFKRDSISYSEERAARLLGAFGTDVEVEEGVKLPFEITDVTEHVSEDAEASRKMATGLWGKIKEADDNVRLAQLTMIGATEDTSDEDGIELAHKFMGQFRAPRKAKANGS